MKYNYNYPMQVKKNFEKLFETTIYLHIIQIYKSHLKQTASVGCEKLQIADDYQNKAHAKIKDAGSLSLSLKC